MPCTDREVTLNAEQVVNEFVAAIGRKDMDAAMALVAKECKC